MIDKYTHQEVHSDGIHSLEPYSVYPEWVRAGDIVQRLKEALVKADDCFEHCGSDYAFGYGTLAEEIESIVKELEVDNN